LSDPRACPERPLPAGWEWSTFSAVATIASNLVPPKAWSHLPHIAPDNIERDTGRLLPFRTIAEDAVTSPKHLFKEGQLLYSKIRPYLNKCVRAGFRGLCSADMYPLDAHIETAYLHYYILSRQFVSAVSDAAGSRTVLPKTNQDQLANVPVPVAAEPEQRRISEAIESYFSRLDDAVATLERVERNLKRYRASVLKAAVEGRLVPTQAALAKQEGRDYEPASVLLERILTERRRRWSESGKKGKYQEPTAPDTTNLPPLPEGWCWATAEALSDETRSITYGVVKLGPEYPGGVPTLRSSNVRSLRLELDHMKLISPRLAAEYGRTTLHGQEVLVTVRGTLGGVTVAPEACSGFNISREVAMIALVDPRVSSCVATFIASTRLQNWMLNRARGITYRGVNIETLKQMPIPLPPLAEQQRIEVEASRLLSLAESGKTTERAVKRRCARLRQSILKWAFEGKLADQDPVDEPASVLLERIQAEREIAKPAKAAHPQRPVPRKRVRA
jgi:type I restriction enzyme, S subunit